MNKYISRNIKIRNRGNTEEIISDENFFGKIGPKVLLGEPGSGKSETIRQFSKKLNIKRFDASTLINNPNKLKQLGLGNILIDALDEVTIDKHEALSKISNILFENNISNFTISCRAFDWSYAVNQRTILDVLDVPPIIGNIVQLDDAKIDEFLTANFSGDKNQFRIKMNELDASAFSVNPQLLTMLIDVVNKGSWPFSKIELFEEFTKKASSEHNDIRIELQKKNYPLDDIRHATGFLFSIQYLCGKSYISNQQNDNDFSLYINDVLNQNITSEIIIETLSTKLFTKDEDGKYTASHKLIAEYLAANFLTLGLKNGNISPRRLVNLLTINGVIPTSIRGIASWLATLSPIIRSQIISLDAWSCLRYGDIHNYSDGEIKLLLSELELLSEVDPYFASDEWELKISPTLARLNVIADFKRILSNPNISRELKTIVTESIKKADISFKTSVEDELKKLLLSTSVSRGVRYNALIILQEISDEQTIKQLIFRLSKFEDEHSIELAIELLNSHTKLFDGSQIAKYVLQYNEIKSLNRDDNFYFDYQNQIFSKINGIQATEMLNYFLQLKSKAGDESRNKRNLLYDLSISSFERIIESGYSVSVPTISKLIRSYELEFHNRNQKNDISQNYFLSNEKIRHQIQDAFINKCKSGSELWDSLWRLFDCNIGVSPFGSDIIRKLSEFNVNKLRREKSKALWKELVQWGVKFVNGNGSEIDVLEFAKTQSNGNLDLEDFLTKLTSPKIPTWQIRHEEEERNRKVAEEAASLIRWGSFSDNKTQMAIGTNLVGLGNAANAYLNMLYETNNIDAPLSRLRHLVGDDCYEATLEGLEAILQKNETVTLKEMVEFQVSTPGKQKWEKLIILVAIAIRFQKANTLENLKFEHTKVALWACEWGIWRDEKANLADLEAALRKLVFLKFETAKEYIDETITPFLLNGDEHVSGLYQICTSETLSGVATALLPSWLEEIEKISKKNLYTVLRLAINNLPNDKLNQVLKDSLSKISKSDEKYQTFIAFAFATDFTKYEQLIIEYCNSNPETMWNITSFVTNKDYYENNLKFLDAKKLFFLINQFANKYPPIAYPKSGWSIGQPFDGYQMIYSYISTLGRILTNEATQALEKLIKEGKLVGHTEHAKHVLQKHKREMAQHVLSRSVQEVKSVLESGQPFSIEDIQATTFDELESFQRNIRDGIWNITNTFWNNDIHHDENTSRDVLGSHLDNLLKRYELRIDKERAKKNDTRCDLVITKGLTDLPIEIKGQWHNKLFIAAKSQLVQNYSIYPTSNGYGIYLVLWFSSNIEVAGRKYKIHPQSANDLLNLLNQKYLNTLDDKTMIFVLDLSKEEIKAKS